MVRPFFDDKRHPDFAGHAGNTLPDNVVRIPFVVYMSDSLRKEAPRALATDLESARPTVMTDLLPHLHGAARYRNEILPSGIERFLTALQSQAPTNGHPLLMAQSEFSWRYIVLRSKSMKMMK